MVPSLLLAASTAAAWVWPNPLMDALDNNRFDQTGFNSPGQAGFVNPCNQLLFQHVENLRSNAADWIRTAFHDMATHNVTDGTGGLDASIQFEMDRAENVGTGFFNTLSVLGGFTTQWISFADSVALGALIAIEQCGGPQVAFRGGRVTATVANAPGVPEPQQPLESHIASFERQGFTQMEMISLVACGHSFGGVQHSAFPTIVPESAVNANNTDGQQTFDTTPFTFDNNVAKEFIKGTTLNPLVVGANVTTRSDARIFSSDHNITMGSFAHSETHFASTCGDLFTRMLDTVPRGVKLTDVVTPHPSKPQDVALVYMGNSTALLTGTVRFLGLDSNNPPAATLHWAPRHGTQGGSVSMLTEDFMVSASPYTGNHTWYQYGPVTDGFMFPIANGLSSLWFSVNGKTFDQDGRRFPMDDTVMFANGTCADFLPNVGPFFDVKVAVRKDAGKPSHVFMNVYEVDDVVTPPNSTLFVDQIDETIDLAPVETDDPVITLWAGRINAAAPVVVVIVNAVIDGKTHSTTSLNTENPFVAFGCPEGQFGSSSSSSSSASTPTVAPSRRDSRRG